mmetsp:Transcript_3832/g.9594  ORF Transcript_3832/g.9594 Transcript_3832/m.9594 type:complete len:243 (+) Transcript_3832:93-821(+)
MVPRRGRSPRSSALRAASWSQPSPHFPPARHTFASGNFGVRDRNHGGRGRLTREPSFEERMQPIVLEEVIDDSHELVQTEWLAYAAWLGIDIDKDADLLWIARAGITAPLPMPWKPCQAADDGDVFYFNFDTGESVWDHPSDEYHRRLLIIELDKKYGLPSLDEPTPCPGGADAHAIGGDAQPAERVQDVFACLACGRGFSAAASSDPRTSTGLSTGVDSSDSRAEGPFEGSDTSSEQATEA